MHLHLFRRSRWHRARALTVTLISAATLALPGVAQASTQSAAQPRKGAAPAADTRPAAPTQLSNCPQYSLCLWQNSGYSGNMWAWSNSKFPKDTDIWVGGSANDQASSYYNDRDDTSEVAKDYPSDFPDIVTVYSGFDNSNLANAKWPDGTSMNDSISTVVLLDSN